MSGKRMIMEGHSPDERNGKTLWTAARRRNARFAMPGTNLYQAEKRREILLFATVITGMLSLVTMVWQ